MTETAGMPNRVVELLEDEHLIRGETRGGSKWLELTHDRLVDPIRCSNEEWSQKHIGQAVLLWVQEHKMALAVPALLALGLIFLAGMQSYRAELAQERADAQKERAEKQEELGKQSKNGRL